MFPTTLFLLIFILLVFHRFIQQIRAVNSKEITQTMGQDSKRKAHPSPSRHDIYHVAFLLQQKLPPELVPTIIDYAELWLRSHTFTTQERGVHDLSGRIAAPFPEEVSGLTHISSLPIGEVQDEAENGIALVGLHPIRRIDFTIESRDQGWSSFPNDHGTERNSWTWFEALAREAEELRYQDVLEQNYQEEDTGIANPDTGDPEPRTGVRIMTNLHAEKKWRTRTISWDLDSDDREIREWMVGLERGQIVDLLACAKYPGWTNHVRAASIDVYVAVVR